MMAIHFPETAATVLAKSSRIGRAHPRAPVRVKLSAAMALLERAKFVTTRTLSKMMAAILLARCKMRLLSVWRPNRVNAFRCAVTSALNLARIVTTAMPRRVTDAVPVASSKPVGYAPSPGLGVSPRPPAAMTW